MIEDRQSTFSGGEISEDLHGRTDLSRYLNSLHLSRNGFSTRHGVWMNRPGTQFVANAKYGPDKIRLMPFNFANGQNYVLEIGHQYIRFIKDGGQVLNLGIPYEIGTPYNQGDLPRLKFAQVGDIITITHSAHAPRELRRYSNVNWVLTTISFASPAHGVAPDLSTYLGSPEDYPVWLADKAYIDYDWTLATTLAKKDYRYKLTMMLRDNATFQIRETAAFSFGPSGAAESLLPGAQVRDVTETAWSSAAVAYASGDIVKLGVGDLYWCFTGHTSSVLNSPSNKSTWGNQWWPLVVGTQLIVHSAAQSFGAYLSLPENKPRIGWPGFVAPTGFTLLGYRLYRGQEGVFGQIADLPSTSKSFVDDGSVEVDYTRSPPSEDDPFVTDWPACVAFFEQRRMLANTPLRPADMLGSMIGDFNNFGWKSLINDDDAITGIRLASMSFEEIRWMFPLRALLAATNEGVWMVSGAGGINDALAPSSVKARKQVLRPMSWLDPIAVDNAILATQDMGGFVRELIYDYATDSYQSSNMSIMSEHLFDEMSIVSWAFAQEPFGIVWAARSDGALLGLTYSREQEVAAWHHHDTRGEFEQVCVIQEGQETAVYFSIYRIINGLQRRFIERFAPRALPETNGVPDVAKGVFLDCSLTYSGVAATIISGLDYLEGEEVTALADGNVLGPYTVNSGDIDISADMPDGATRVTVGMGYVSQLETLDAIANGIDLKSRIKRVVRVMFEVVESRGIKVGMDFDHLIEWRQRTPALVEAAIPVETGAQSVTVPGSFGVKGRAVVQQDYPLPVTLISLTREVEVGD